MQPCMRIVMIAGALFCLFAGIAAADEGITETDQVYGKPLRDPSISDISNSAVTVMVPALEWVRSFGGSGNDEFLSVREAPGGGYIIVGSTTSNDGQVSGNHNPGAYDVWVVQVLPDGSLSWQKALGGSSRDMGRSVVPVSGGGYIFTGFTESTGGDVTGNHGSSDVWVVKLQSGGEPVWQKCLGGSLADQGYSIEETSDGGYILGGDTASTNGDATGNHGSNDGWVVRLDADGGIVWQTCIGGADSDHIRRVRETADGGYIAVGFTYSNSTGNVGTNHGSSDIVIAKLSGDGTLDWSRCLGGTGTEFGYDIAPASDGGYLMLGVTGSFNGDISGNHGSTDAWLVKLDASGEIDWQQCYGGSGADYCYTIAPIADGGYAICGYTFSNNGDVSGLHGDRDVWVARIDAAGSLLWQKCIGGLAGDFGYGIIAAIGGNCVIAGSTQSSNGDMFENHGMWDAALINLEADLFMANFSANSTAGEVPFAVRFTDLSTGAVSSWFWEFGDGNTSTTRHPVHTYTVPGNYTIALTVTGAGLSDTRLKSDLIRATAPDLIAEFTANCTDGKAPLDVQFTDLSSGAVTDWYWDFGDGAISSDRHPAHTFTTPGTFSVSLTVHDAYGGISTSVRSGYVSTWVDPVGIVWMRSLGGSDSDIGQNVIAAPDGGFVLVGNTVSDDFQVSGNHGADDLWVVKASSGGALVWQQCYGSSGTDCGYDIAATQDGGYIAAGATSSTTGQVVGNHGGTDVWLLKLTPDGGLVWQRCLGGTGDEVAYGVAPAADGGYAIAGYTNSSDSGDVSGLHGSSDGWVVKVDRTGMIEWQRCLGGTGPDVLHAIRQTPEGGYIAAGCTYSNSSGDIGITKGNGDLWLVKLTGAGMIDWQRSYGGQQYDSAFDIYPAGDGGFIIAGSSASDDGDIVGHLSDADYWVLRTNSAGAIRWQQSLGGSGSDFAYAVRPTDSGWIIAGTVYGGGYDVTGYRGGADVWAVKLDDAGNHIWQRTLGTEQDDLCTGVVPTADGCMLGGSSRSDAGLFSENHGRSDVLAVRLLPPAVSGPEPASDTLSLSPGWNFISTPRRLADGYNTAGVLFGSLDTDGHSILAYNASTGKWSVMTAASIIRPLDGIWVYAKAAASIPLTFATGETQAPPLKVLPSGWNAVGISGTGQISARDCLLTVQDRWTTVIGWDAIKQHFRTSIINGGSGINSDGRKVYPTEGVWVFMTDDGVLGAVSG